MSNVLRAARNRIVPALVTPLTSDGQLDVASAERLIDHLYRSGVGGLYVGGSTGEGIYLDVETRKRLVELAVSALRGRGYVIAHVGAIEGSLAFELARHASSIGADGVASIPPFAGGYSWDEVQGYYRQLCAASSVPVIAYYIPGLTGQPMPIDKLAALAELPGVAGFKVTDSNLYTLQRLSTRLRPDQVLYNGPDELLALGLQFGAHGGIGSTYNVMPKVILEIASRVASGKTAEAVATQKCANDVIESLLSFPSLPAHKQALVWQGILSTATCAAPRAALSEQQQAELRKRLDQTVMRETFVR